MISRSTYLNTLIAAMSLLFMSCNNNSEERKQVPKEKIAIDNQGVNINYTDSGTGDTVLFFVHGWGINQTYWSNQVAHFSGRYRVITIDLPGFGNSGKNRSSWTVEDYGRDLTAVLTKLDLQHVILIGHSMSGAVVVETALTNTDRVIGVVGVDNFQDVKMVITPEIRKQWDAFYDSARINFKQTVTKVMAPDVFAVSTPDSIRKRVLDDVLRSDPDMAITCLQNADKYPLDKKLGDLKKKLILINSTLHPTDTADLRNTGVSYDLLIVGPTGHYPMIEDPSAFNTILQQGIERLKVH